MNLIRKSAWAMVVLGVAVAGCGGEEKVEPVNPAPSNPPAAPSKPAPPPTKAEPAKETPKAGPAVKTDDMPKLEAPKSEPAKTGAAKEKTGAVTLTPDEIATIKQLPAADQTVALKQAVCPVSDGHLGEMGKPFKTIVDGKTVFLCCQDCEKEVKSDPKKYLAKLDAEAAQK